jgi:hypothetical protein
MTGVARDEFQNFRQDASDHFRQLHECDMRIEGKIDALTEKLNPVIEEHKRKQEARSFRKEVKLLVIGTLFGAAGTIAVYLLT